jgi:hypothetical protein
VLRGCGANGFDLNHSMYAATVWDMPLDHPHDGPACPRYYLIRERAVECMNMAQEDTMTRPSKLSICIGRASPRQVQSKIRRLLRAHYSSILEAPVPSELRGFVVQLLAIEAPKHHSTARAIEVPAIGGGVDRTKFQPNGTTVMMGAPVT